MKNLLPLMVKEPGFGVLVKCRGICFSNFMHCLLSVYSFIDMSEANYFFPSFFIFLSPNLVPSSEISIKLTSNVPMLGWKYSKIGIEFRLCVSTFWSISSPCRALSFKICRLIRVISEAKVAWQKQLLVKLLESSKTWKATPFVNQENKDRFSTSKVG